MTSEYVSSQSDYKLSDMKRTEREFNDLGAALESSSSS